MNFFLFHGVGGCPDENWFGWIKTELENLGHKVFIPDFPTPEDQTLENWIRVIEKYDEYINEDTVLIGHSLGATFILSVLEKYKVNSAYFIAGFTGAIDHKFDESMRTFAQKNFDWVTIKNNCQNFYVYHSDDDPYLPLEKGRDLANKLGVKLTFIPNCGHFNLSAGFTKFERLLEDINLRFIKK